MKKNKSLPSLYFMTYDLKFVSLSRESRFKEGERRSSSDKKKKRGEERERRTVIRGQVTNAVGSTLN